MEVDNQCNLGIIGDPSQKRGKLSRGTQVLVHGEHRIIGGCKVAWSNVDGIRGAFGKKAIPSVRTGGDIYHNTFIHFTVNKSKGLGTGRKRFLGRLSAREESTMEASIIFEFRKWIFQDTGFIEAVVCRYTKPTSRVGSQNIMPFV
jgi:hypothetical protein